MPEPTAYQKRELARVKEAGGTGLLAHSVGTGKTYTSIWATLDGPHDRVLIIAPLRTLPGWESSVRELAGAGLQVIRTSTKAGKGSTLSSPMRLTVLLTGTLSTRRCCAGCAPTGGSHCPPRRQATNPSTSTGCSASSGLTSTPPSDASLTGTSTPSTTLGPRPAGASSTWVRSTPVVSPRRRLAGLLPPPRRRMGSCPPPTSSTCNASSPGSSGPSTSPGRTTPSPGWVITLSPWTCRPPWTCGFARPPSASARSR